MKKNIILKTIVALSLSLLILPMANIKAAESKQNEAEKVAIEYLTAIKEGNIDKILSLSENNTNISLEERKADLNSLIANPNKDVKDFSILSSEKFNDYSIVKCRISYLNGQVVEDQMKVIDKDVNNTYVSIERIENPTEKVIKEGKRINNIVLFASLMRWSTNVDAGDRSFSGVISTGNSYVDLNYRNGGNIRYRMVKDGWFSLTPASWAAETGPNPDSPNQVRLNARPDQNLYEVKLEITCWATPGGFSYGEIYA